MILLLCRIKTKFKSNVLNSFHVTTMSQLSQTAAILVVVALFTSVAGSPRPEEAKNEIDNTIPKVGENSMYRYIQIYNVVMRVLRSTTLKG